MKSAPSRSLLPLASDIKIKQRYKKKIIIISSFLTPPRQAAYSSPLTHAPVRVVNERILYHLFLGGLQIYFYLHIFL